MTRREIGMRDPYNPTPDDIRAWAAQPDAVEPVQDWDLMLIHEPNEELYLELAGDYGCPTREYFLALLYLVVGEAVGSGFRSRPREEVLKLLERSRRIRLPSIRAWRLRVRALLDDPQSFDYDAWCAGGLAGAETRDD